MRRTARTSKSDGSRVVVRDHGHMRRIWALIAAGILTVSLAGCTDAQPAPTPSASPRTEPPTATTVAPVIAATPTPTSSPGPGSEDAALVISATDLTLLDEQGRVRPHLNLRGEDPTQFAESISTAAGSEVTETTKPGGPEGAKFTATFTWEGLIITTFFSPDECADACRGTFVSSTSPRIGAVPVRTVSGISVGDTVTEAKARGAHSTSDHPLASDPEDPSLFDSTTEATRVVLLSMDENSAVITDIGAGAWYVSFGGCEKPDRRGYPGRAARYGAAVGVTVGVGVAVCDL